jgi:hypothetical protein
MPLRLLLALLFFAAGTAHAQRPAIAPAPNPSLARTPAVAPILGGYDVFVVAGQSNAKGNGDRAASERATPGAAYEMTRRGRFEHLADPVGNARTGSAWPAFAKAYTARTGRGVVVLPLAKPGSHQYKNPWVAPGNHWDVRHPGNLYEPAAAAAAQAYAVAEASLPDVRFGGWLWIQGGADAIAMRDGQQTGEDYRRAYHAMARRVHADWGAPVLHILTGTSLAEDPPEARELRRIQAESDALDEVVVIYRDAYRFAERGWHVDDVHWDQRGLNEAGRVGGDHAGLWRNGEPIPEADPQPQPEPGYAGGPGGLPSERLVVAPNPVLGAFSVTASCAFEYELYDSRGRLLRRGRVNQPSVRLRRGTLPPGQYGLATRPLSEVGRDGRRCRAATTTFTVLG